MSSAKSKRSVNFEALGRSFMYGIKNYLQVAETMVRANYLRSCETKPGEIHLT